MDDEMKKVCAALVGIRRGKGRRFSAELRTMMVRAALGLRAKGRSWPAIGGAMGVPGETARRLCIAAGAVKPRRRGGFTQVTIAEDGGAVTRSSATLVLVCPSGYRVEGLDAAAAVDLLRRLR